MEHLHSIAWDLSNVKSFYGDIWVNSVAAAHMWWHLSCHLIPSNISRWPKKNYTVAGDQFTRASISNTCKSLSKTVASFNQNVFLQVLFDAVLYYVGEQHPEKSKASGMSSPSVLFAWKKKKKKKCWVLGGRVCRGEAPRDGRFARWGRPF